MWHHKKVMKEMRRKKEVNKKKENNGNYIRAKEEQDIPCPVVDSKMYIPKEALFIRLI
jgi:hypothetical protein